MEKVAAYADRLVIMNKGRVARDGRPETLLSELAKYGIRPPCASRLGMAVMPWLESE
jgi:energy-coupling factor transporter ATP-binding protein EcfA2